MSYEERRSSRKTKRVLYYVFLGLVVFFVIFIVLRFVFDVSDETVLPTSVIYYNKIKTVGFPILKQKIYSVGEMTSSEIYHKEGERVSAGTKLAFLSQYGSGNGRLLHELRMINHRLSGADNNTSESYFSTVNDLQRKILNGFIGDIAEEESRLLKSDTAFFFTDEVEMTPLSDNIDEKTLLDRKQAIEAEIKTVQKIIYSEFGGIVSYFVTPVDENFSNTSISDFSYSDFEKVERQFQETETHKKKGLRLIDNFSTTIVLKIDEYSNISKLSIGNRIRLFHEQVGEVDAIVEKIMESEGKALIFLAVNREVHKFYSVGFSNFTVILEKRESYQLPLQALISDERGDGVYINYKSGIVKYRPVLILAKDEEFIYVSKGNRSGKILLDSTGEMHYTIGRFDPVYIHPDRLSEDVIVQ